MGRESGVKIIMVTLKARARPTSPGRLIDQEEACAWWGVTARTLRNWAAIGLPTETSDAGRTAYPVPDANVWATIYQSMCAESRHGRGPTYLTLQEAREKWLARQASESPGAFVIVPLDHTHPARLRQLQRAAEGMPARHETETEVSDVAS